MVVSDAAVGESDTCQRQLESHTASADSNTCIVANSEESIGLEATTNLDTSTPRDMLHTAAPIVVINDVSVLKVSSEEMGYQLAEKEIKKLDQWEENLHTPVPVANVTVMKDKTPDKFVPTRQQISEIKSFNPNILPMVVSDNATVESGACHGKLESTPKRSPPAKLEESISFLPNLFEFSMMKGLEGATNLVLGTPNDMKENIQSFKKKKVGTIVSRKTTFPKRQALEDLQQN